MTTTYLSKVGAGDLNMAAEARMPDSKRMKPGPDLLSECRNKETQVTLSEYPDDYQFDERTPILVGSTLMQTPLMWAVHNRKNELALELVYDKEADVLQAICDYVAWLYRKAPNDPSWNVAPCESSDSTISTYSSAPRVKFPTPGGNFIHIGLALPTGDAQHRILVLGYKFNIYVNADKGNRSVIIDNIRLSHVNVKTSDGPLTTVKAVLDLAYHIQARLVEEVEQDEQDEQDEEDEEYEEYEENDQFDIRIQDGARLDDLTFGDYHDVLWSAITCVAYGEPYYTYVTKQLYPDKMLLPVNAAHYAYDENWWIKIVKEIAPTMPAVVFRDQMRRVTKALRNKTPLPLLEATHMEILQRLNGDADDFDNALFKLPEQGDLDDFYRAKETTEALLQADSAAMRNVPYLRQWHPRQVWLTPFSGPLKF